MRLHSCAILHILHASFGFHLSTSVTSQPNYIHSQGQELETVLLFWFFFLFWFHEKLWLVDTPVSEQLRKNPIHYVQYQEKLFCFFRDSVDVRSSSMKRSTNMGKLSLWCVYITHILKKGKVDVYFWKDGIICMQVCISSDIFQASPYSYSRIIHHTFALWYKNTV